MNKEKVISELKRIGAPELLIGIVTGESKAPGSLEWQIQEPLTYFYLMEYEKDSIPYEDIAIPLWETNGDRIIAYVPLEKPIVYQHYYEDKIDDYKILGNEVSAAVFHLLSWMFLEAEEELDVVLEWAKILEYPDIEQLQKDLEFAEQLDYDEYLEWQKEKFKSS